MSCVNHGYARRLIGRLLGSKGMRMGGGYLMPTEEYEHEAFCDGESEVIRLFRILENV
jgi:hypothetical protein